MKKSIHILKFKKPNFYRNLLTDFRNDFSTQKAMLYAGFMHNIKKKYPKISYQNVFGSVQTLDISELKVEYKIVRKKEGNRLLLLFIDKEQHYTSCYIDDIYEYLYGIEQRKLDKAIKKLVQSQEELSRLKQGFLHCARPKRKNLIFADNIQT